MQDVFKASIKLMRMAPVYMYSGTPRLSHEELCQTTGPRTLSPAILLRHRNSEGYPVSNGTRQPLVRFRARSHFRWGPVHIRVWLLKALKYSSIASRKTSQCEDEAKSFWMPPMEVLLGYGVLIRSNRVADLSVSKSWRQSKHIAREPISMVFGCHAMPKIGLW